MRSPQPPRLRGQYFYIYRLPLRGLSHCMQKVKKQDALDYHSSGRPGKIEVVPTKPYSSQRDLSLAYSPGVAEPCLRIADRPDDAYKYTAKGNLVAVISNGTAVLGLGNIGALASKPVMEGKGLLFKIFADIDVFDIEIDATDVNHFVETVKAIAPTFGGINLEDIKAPEAFEIEKRLKAELNIPVMHDDQHGTAIISSAALLNALEIAGKKVDEVKVVVSGAGAAATSCIKMYFTLGVKPENLIMVDSKGVISTDRTDLDEQKRAFARSTPHKTLAEAMRGADVFLGLSVGGVVSPEMLKTMAPNAIVFACANPEPEIAYDVAVKARPDIIMATGRSDFPNQVNNVLGFPFIFRGALDVRATTINEEMKLAAVLSLAALAKETVPVEVTIAYGKSSIAFGREYIIPKPLDYRLITTVAPAVAKAAMDSGVAQQPITDWDAYVQKLDERLGRDNKLIQSITQKARLDPKRVVFAEADHFKILKAAQIVRDEGVAVPVLLGNKERIQKIMRDNALDLEGVEIIDARSQEEEGRRNRYAEVLFAKRKRRGVTYPEARKIMRERNYFGAAMVECGEADVLISGLTRNYAATIKPALHVIGTDPKVRHIAGMYVLLTKSGPIFLADTTINLNPTSEELVEITLLVARAVERFKLTPRIALLSYSNFGSSNADEPMLVRNAVRMLHERYPNLVVDGEIQANFALNNELLSEMFPFSKLVHKEANVLIFPNLAAGNIAYKIMQEMGVGEAIGPILLGMQKPVHILQLGSSVREIVNMITIGVVDAQTR